MINQRWLVTLALLVMTMTPALSIAFDTKAKFQAVTVRDQGTDFLENPFIAKCFQASSAARVSVPRVEVSIDEETRQHMYTVRFNGVALAPRLILTNGQKVELEKSSEKTGFILSVLRPGPEEFVSRLAIQNAEKDVIEYTLRIHPGGAVFQEQLTDEQARRVCIKNQIWVGAGFSTLAFDQTITGIDASSKFTAITPGSYLVDARYYPNSQWGFFGSYKSAPGKITSSGASAIDSVAFDRKIYEFGFQWRNYDLLKRWRDHLFYPYLRMGYQYHQMPSIFIADDATASLATFQNQQMALGAGVNVFNRNSMFYEAYINYKHPFASSGATLTPKLHFDGAIGVGRALKSGVSLGVFWHGHYDHFTYAAERNGFENRGETTLLFWNVDFKVGWAF